MFRICHIVLTFDNGVSTRPDPVMLQSRHHNRAPSNGDDIAGPAAKQEVTSMLPSAVYQHGLRSQMGWTFLHGLPEVEKPLMDCSLRGFHTCPATCKPRTTGHSDRSLLPYFIM